MIRAARFQAAESRRTGQTASPILADIAQVNANFADQWADLAESIVALSDRVDDAVAKLQMTTRDFEDVNSKLTHYGLTPTIGLLLRHKKEQLEEWQVHDSDTLFASQKLQGLRQKQLELEMVRHDGSDAVAQTAAILADAGYDSASIQNASLASDVERLLRQRQQWLGSLQQGYQDYREKFGELDSATTASAKLTDDYRKLIDRHVTWIRSDDAVSTADLRNVKGGLAAMFDSGRSADFGPSLSRKWNANPVSGIGLLVWIILISVVRMRAKSWLIGIGNQKRMREATANARNVAAGILTTLIAVSISSILYAIGRWLGGGVVSESTLHASSGFYAASLVALMVEVPRHLLRNHGYVHKHVQVDLPRRERAIAYLTLIGFGLVLAAYMITVMGLIDHGMWRGSVVRFGFMAAMLLVAWTAHLSLKPTGGFLEPLIAKFGGSVVHRVRFVVYLAGIGFPLVMIVLSSLGYGFTANELIKRAIITLVSLLIAGTLWTGVKIVSAHAWQLLTGAPPPPRQFDQYGEIEPDKGSGGTVTGALAEHSLELKHHLAFLCQCALVMGAIVSFGWLWIDVFPNVRMGNPVVWTVQETVTQSSVDAAGQTITDSVVETTPITALHLLLAAATLFVAFQLAKLLPALFDALVLQRVSFDEGMEHFSLVLGRCVLFGVGCFVASNLIGIRWQAIQWLAVGLTIGLGFGLQDMVRNLFGGLIVLFEKPARLGDLITVGPVTGRVAMQRLRTTVLSDDDGREVTIPNKNFVNEEVVNWMGAGRLNVIPIEVAVSRDERPADICRRLQELVIDQPEVLLTPAPQATLVCVAKSSQRIEIRAWIEQDQDACRFRESLLTTVRRFLREKHLLAATQPSQPTMRGTSDVDRSDTYRSRPNRGRKRSA
jgi:small-conductance mechanosensitive channel